MSSRDGVVRHARQYCRGLGGPRRGCVGWRGERAAQGGSHHEPGRLRVLRLRQPLLRGDRRLHPPRREGHGEPHDAVGRDQRPPAAARRRQGQPLHPQPHVGPDLQARRARRVLPRPQPQGRGHQGALRRPRPAQRAPRVPRPRRPPQAHGRAGHGRRDLPAHPRRRHGAGAARRPARAARRVPRVQPLARRRLGLRLPGADLRPPRC